MALLADLDNRARVQRSQSSSDLSKNCWRHSPLGNISSTRNRVWQCDRSRNEVQYRAQCVLVARTTMFVLRQFGQIFIMKSTTITAANLGPIQRERHALVDENQAHNTALGQAICANVWMELLDEVLDDRQRFSLGDVESKPVALHGKFSVFYGLATRSNAEAVSAPRTVIPWRTLDGRGSWLSVTQGLTRFAAGQRRSK